MEVPLDFHSQSCLRRFFIVFVQRVVRCHCNLPCVRKLELRCFGAYNVSRICKLISAAASRMPNVEEVHLDFCTEQLLFGFGTEKLVELPQNIYAYCERLQVLKVSGDIVMNIPPLVPFSSLKTLRLTLVHYKNDDSLEKFLVGSPILENLYIQPLLTFSETVNVCSSTLRNLEIHNDIPPLRAAAQRGRFVLQTPNLEQLKLRDHSEGDYKVKDASSLVSANVDFRRPHKITSLLQLLKKISHVGELLLSNHTVDILEENPNDEIPFFHNSTHLKVGISKVSKSIVPRLLERSPNLASFKVEKVSAQPGEGSK